MPSRPAAEPTTAPARQGLWHQHRGIILILLAHLFLGTLYSVTTPILEASDELWHFPFVKRLADGQGLPVQYPDQIGPWRQEGSQPPLYYALGALLIRWVDTSDMQAVRWINPHASIGLPTQDRNVNMVVHTPRERFPYRGTVLAIHLVRWMSVLLGALTVLAGYLLARELFPEDLLLALTAASLTAFNAMYLFITASVNNDALVVALCSLCLWLMVKYIVVRPKPKQWASLGVLLGLASLSKASALGILPLAVVTVLAVAWRHRSWRDLFLGGLWVGLPVLAIGGWWYYRNWQLYRDPLGLSAFVAIVGARHPQPTLWQLIGEWKGFVMSYWGFFGGVNVAAPGWVYWLLSVMALLGLLAAPVYLWRAYQARQMALERWLQMGLVFIWPCLVFASLVRWTLMTIASQGRLMFAALTALSLLMAMGLAGLSPRRVARSGRSYRTARPYRTAWPGALLPATMAVAMMGIALWLPFGAIRPAYTMPRILQEQEVSGLTARLDATFGGQMRLMGYRLDRDQLAPGASLPLTLYWQSLAPMRENYSIFVHLLGANDLIIGQRDVYPGQGNYPTTLWSPGEIIADTYWVNISPTALTPSEAQFEVGLYRLETGTRLEVVDVHGAQKGDNLRFGRLTLPERILNGIPNPTFLNLGDQIALIGYRLDRTAAAPREILHLTLYWQALRNPDTNYTVFTHVLGEQQRIWAQKDSQPQGGQAPTSSWRKGQLVEDSYDLAISADAPAGVYDLEIGMYAGNKRLSLLGKGGHVQDNRILLGKVRVLPRTGGQ